MEAATAPTPIRQPAKEAAGTEYVILQRVETPANAAAPAQDAWRVVDTAASGAGPEAAIRKSREGKKGAFKAVSVRYWRGGLDLDTETREVTVSRRIQD
jgi:hypothetical protein